MDIEQFRRAGYAAIDSICDYYTTLSQRPVKAEVEPGYLIEKLPRQPPVGGESFETIAADFQQLILPGITHWQHPKFFAYFPSISTFESMLGELYSASVSNPGFNWICSPACTELEQVVMDWMTGLLGLSTDFLTSGGIGGGIILNSASEAALTACIAARENALRYLSDQSSDEGSSTVLGSDIPQGIRDRYGQRLVMYGSTQTHSLGAKAARLLGLIFRALPVHEADAYALRGKEVAEAMAKDVEDGLVPFFVVATVGTTSTGAVDQIAEIGKAIERFPTVFMHVDAAWAGVAFALPDQRQNLRLTEVNSYADSFCTNMHKWGLVGFDCSLFYVRKRRVLTDAMDVTPAYLRTKEGDSGTVIDYRNWQLALGRRFRSVKLWFVLRSFGSSGFQRHIEVGIGHCQQLERLVRDSPIFEVVAPPKLTLLVFRLVPVGQDQSSDAELNLLNQQLHNRLSARRDVFLTQTVLHSVEREIFCIRLAAGGVNTKWEDVEGVWQIVVDEGTQLLELWRKEQSSS